MYDESEVIAVNEDLKLIMDELKSIKDNMTGMESRLNERIDALEKRIEDNHAETSKGFETLANMIDDLGEKIDSMETITQKNLYDITLMKQRKA